MKNVTILGGGLAGSEAALQLIKHGFHVQLIDAKPSNLQELYSQPSYGELICSNSLGGIHDRSPKALLIDELRTLGSAMISIGDACRIEDKYYCAVDKERFSGAVTKMILESGVECISKYASEIPTDDWVIVATGASTNPQLMKQLSDLFGIKNYYFADASCPIVDIRTVDMEDNGIKKLSNDLYAVIFNEEVKNRFYQALLFYNENRQLPKETLTSAYNKNETIEGCASLGIEILEDEKLSSDYLVGTPHILLRREKAMNSGFILDRCTTTLRNSEQKALFALLPALRDCKYFKFGRMHPNTFINSPETLDCHFRIKGTNTFIAGQLSGVDDYAPAIASGWIAAAKIIYGEKLAPLPRETMIGALAHYVSNEAVTEFKPTGPSFALLSESDGDAFHVSRVAIQKYLSALT